MKKVLTTITVLLLLLLTACGGGSTPSGTDSPSTTAAGSESASTGSSGEPVTVVMWSSGRHDYEIYAKPLIDKWNAEHSDIKIDYQIYTENFLQTVEIAAQNNELPDIIMALPQTMVTMLLERGEVASMEPYLTDEERANIDPSMLIEGLNLMNGEIFTHGGGSFAMRLVVNNDILEECGLSGPPKTVDQLIEYAKIVHEKKGSEGVYGFALPMNNPTDALQRGFTSIVTLDGATALNGYDFKQGKYDFSCYKPIMEKLRELWASGAVFPGCESLSIDPLRTQFAAGKIAMYTTYNHSEWGVYTAQFPTDVHWSYEMLPTMDGVIEGSQNMGGGVGWMMLNASKDKDATYKVIQYFGALENRVKFYELGLGMTTDKQVLENAAVPESIGYTPFMAFQPTDKMWPLTPLSMTLEGDEYGQEFAKYIYGFTDDLDSIVTICNDRYNAAYDKSIAEGRDIRRQYPNFNAADPAGTSK
ncbi:MAG: extracellular solute-binding protein [Peptococcaceae bacterium]|nr:extracellular solute-binding protein [Peptococcaceae bacterium]